MMNEQFQTLMDEHDYDGARAVLNQITDLSTEFGDVVDVTGPCAAGPESAGRRGEG